MSTLGAGSSRLRLLQLAASGSRGQVCTALLAHPELATRSAADGLEIRRGIRTGRVVSAIVHAGPRRRNDELCVLGYACSLSAITCTSSVARARLFATASDCARPPALVRTCSRRCNLSRISTASPAPSNCVVSLVARRHDAPGGGLAGYGRDEAALRGPAPRRAALPLSGRWLKPAPAAPNRLRRGTRWTDRDSRFKSDRRGPEGGR